MHATWDCRQLFGGLATCLPITILITRTHQAVNMAAAAIQQKAFVRQVLMCSQKHGKYDSHAFISLCCQRNLQVINTSSHFGDFAILILRDPAYQTTSGVIPASVEIDHETQSFVNVAKPGNNTSSHRYTEHQKL